MNATPDAVLFAFALTLFAGLATGIGSAIAFFARRTNYRFLAVSLAFSAGVMLYVSFLEIMPKAQAALALTHSERTAGWLAALSFFGGMALIGLIDWFVPGAENPHEVRAVSEVEQMRHEIAEHHGHSGQTGKLLRMGILAAVAIAIHNFPEGLATFIAALDNPRVGIAIAIAIALHNIPEGVSVSVPIFYATDSRAKAFGWSVLSGLAEPLGAAIGYLLLRTFLSPDVMGFAFGAVAGIMVFISIDELLPTAREYGRGHETIYGVMGGMGVMALSLLLLK
jgi:ZIP family zinc transporter